MSIDSRTQSILDLIRQQRDVLQGLVEPDPTVSYYVGAHDVLSNLCDEAHRLAAEEADDDETPPIAPPAVRDALIALLDGLSDLDTVARRAVDALARSDAERIATDPFIPRIVTRERARDDGARARAFDERAARPYDQDIAEHDEAHVDFHNRAEWRERPAT